MLLEVFFGITFPRYIQAFVFVLFHVKKGLKNKCNVGVNFFLKEGNKITCCGYTSKRPHKNLWSRKTIEYICMCTTSHEILHTVVQCSFCKAGKIAMQDIYTSSVETKYIIICIWWGDFNCWNSKCKMFNSLSQICISSKKVLVV